MKKIPKPDIKSAVELTAMEMNKVLFAKKRTILTPTVLEKIGTQLQDSKS